MYIYIYIYVATTTGAVPTACETAGGATTQSPLDLDDNADSDDAIIAIVFNDCCCCCCSSSSSSSLVVVVEFARRQLRHYDIVDVSVSLHLYDGAILALRHYASMCS